MTGGGLWFIRFPIAWLKSLADVGAGAPAYRLAAHLLLRAMKEDRTIRLTNAGLREAGIGRDGKRAGLRQLQEAGLITVDEDGQGRPPLVSLFHYGGP